MTELPNYDENPIIAFTSDYGFKVTFGNERNTLFLKKALQALIGSPTPIRDIFFDKNTFEGISRESRSGIYDMSCIDEQGNHFIVEMQLSEYKFFLHRLRFYGFHKFNTMVKKGDYKYENLNKIYCIAILSKNITPLPDYHNVGNLRNQNGELMDDSMTFITLELDKFDKTAESCITDLDKLAFTMKQIQEIKDPKQFPPFWTEEWLKSAIEELDTRRMTPEERMAYEMILSNNAIYMNEEKKKAERLKAEGKIEAEAEAQIKQEEIIRNALIKGKLSIEEIAEMFFVSVGYIEKVKAKFDL